MRSTVHRAWRSGALAAARGGLLLLMLACGAEERPQTAAAPAAEKPSAEASEPESPVIERPLRAERGDLPEMRRRRVIRALVTRSRTNFFIEAGRPRGFEVELLEAFEEFVNRDRPRGAVRTSVSYIPVRFEELLPALRAGRGDIAAAGITVTPERQSAVDFGAPYFRDVDEVVVAHRGSADLRALEDLAGRTIHVVSGSSFAQHLRQLSAQFVAKGRPAIEVSELEAHLEVEDLFELVNAGVIELTVSDRHVAELWAPVLRDVVVHAEIAIHSGGAIAWAVRKQNPLLRESVARFMRENRVGTLLGNVLFRRYYGSTQWIRNPLSASESAKLERYRGLFEKYATRYGFRWQEIAAQAYQESGFDHARRSAAGAVGLMQLLPSTAADPQVGISDIGDVENNVHAGVKYLAFLRDRYFADPGIEAAVRFDLSLAAYNMGPRRVSQLRRQAAERGLDPNRWFQNVEVVAREVVGREPVRYVANINKYTIAYTLAERDARRRAAGKASLREQVAGGSG